MIVSPMATCMPLPTLCPAPGGACAAHITISTWLCCTQAGGNSEELQEKSKELKKNILEVEEKEKEVIKARDAKVMLIGNIVHDSVPVSDNEVCVCAGARAMKLAMLLHHVPCTHRVFLHTNTTVPHFPPQDNNQIVKTFGEPRQEEKLYNHVDLVQVSSSSSSWGVCTTAASALEGRRWRT